MYKEYKTLYLHLKDFILLISPMTPHIAEELWENLGLEKPISDYSWPEPIPNLLKKDIITIAIQINGKLKNTINISNSDKDNKDMIIKLALETDNIKKFLNNTEPKKIISVPGKVVNIVV